MEEKPQDQSEEQTEVRKVYLRQPASRAQTLLRILGFCAFVIGGGLGIVLLAVSLTVYLISRDLPQIKTLNDYQPNLVSFVYDRNGQVIGEFKYENQRRIVVPVDRVPKRMIQAFVASEDKNFYEHKGLDYKGIVRAAIKNMRAGEIVQGGSTITQQLTKAMLLTPERSLVRKIKEAVLAPRIENNLTKKQILYLYLNQIYFGNGAYGVQAAAQNYFGINVEDLSLAQIAMLAGLPKAPSRYSPYRNLTEAKDRQAYVLERMVEEGYITEAQRDGALAEALEFRDVTEPNLEVAPYFVEHVRRYLLERYGSDRVLKGGLKIHTTLDRNLQQRANEAVEAGLRELDKRQGYRGALDHLPPEKARAKIESLRSARRGPLKEGEILEAVVTGLDSKRKLVRIDAGVLSGILPLSEMKWTEIKRRGEELIRVPLRDPAKLLRVNDVIQVRIKSLGGDEGAIFSLEQTPEVQGAMVAMDPKTRFVLAMVGGRSFLDSQFNRAVQSHRQPGSAFKPIVYAAAIEAGLTPASMILDTALVFDDGWKPENYGGSFQGKMTLRRALAKSINTATIRLLSQLGTRYVVHYARRMGLAIEAVDDLSVALGSHEVTLTDLVNAYAVFASEGLRIEPIFIARVEDREGRVLEEHRLSEQVYREPLLMLPDLGLEGDDRRPARPLPAADLRDRNEISAQGAPVSGVDPITGEVAIRRVMNRQTAYIMTSMLQSVIREGTGVRAASLARNIAGKTGTTNEYRDAWFIGYTNRIIAGVWTGFDDGSRSLGPRQTGSRAALPIWMDFMREALKDLPDEPFEAPRGITFARIDRATGLLAGPESENSFLECFIDGTEPTQFAPSTPAPRPDEFFRFDRDSQGANTDPPSPALIP